MHRNESEAYSEGLHRNNSLSIDSYTQEKAGSRTNTSSCSNNFLIVGPTQVIEARKKLAARKSKFYKD
jgi:hypothetical protein